MYKTLEPKCIDEELFGDTIPLNKGFGRRIDLLLTSNNTELSTNEWKRKKISQKTCIAQQAKNIRTNKAILGTLYELPIKETDHQSMYTLSMDWNGPQGYMFAVEKMENVYIASHFYTLLAPEYLFQFPDFVNTLDALHSWKRHHIKLEDILLPAVISEKNSFFFFLVPTLVMIAAPYTYNWKRHHIKLEDIPLTAVIFLEKNSFFLPVSTLVMMAIM
ncbi:unnamed protein product [Mucor hiemalis]